MQRDMHYQKGQTLLLDTEISENNDKENEIQPLFVIIAYLYCKIFISGWIITRCVL